MENCFSPARTEISVNRRNWLLNELFFLIYEADGVPAVHANTENARSETGAGLMRSERRRG